MKLGVADQLVLLQRHESRLVRYSNKLLYKRWALSMGNGELRPPTAPKFLDRSLWNSNLRNTSRGPTNMQNTVQIGIRGWAGRTPSLPLFLVLPFVFFSFFCILRTASWPHRWTDFDARWLIARVFRQGSAFWGSRWWKVMFRGQNSPKT